MFLVKNAVNYMNGIQDLLNYVVNAGMMHREIE